MGADVPYAAGHAAVFRLHPPVIVCVKEEPILQVASVNQVWRTDFTGGNPRSCVLNQRIHPVTEVHTRHDFRMLPQELQHPCAFTAGRCQRLLTENVFAGLDNFPIDLHMEIVRRAVVYRVDFRVRDEFIHSRVAAGNRKRIRFFPRKLKVYVCDRI